MNKRNPKKNQGQSFFESSVLDHGKVAQAGQDIYQLDNSTAYFQSNNIFVRFFPGFFLGKKEIEEKLWLTLRSKSKFTINQYLESSVNHRSRLQLGLKNHLDLQEKLWDFEFESSEYKKQDLSFGTKIIDVLNDQGEG